MTHEIATLHFTDMDENDEGVAIVKAWHDTVCLTLSLRHDGDTQACLTTKDAERLADALQQAIRAARAQ